MLILAPFSIFSRWIIYMQIFFSSHCFHYFHSEVMTSVSAAATTEFSMNASLTTPSLILSLSPSLNLSFSLSLTPSHSHSLYSFFLPSFSLLIPSLYLYLLSLFASSPSLFPSLFPLPLSPLFPSLSLFPSIPHTLSPNVSLNVPLFLLEPILTISSQHL